MSFSLFSRFRRRKALGKRLNNGNWTSGEGNSGAQEQINFMQYSFFNLYACSLSSLPKSPFISPPKRLSCRETKSRTASIDTALVSDSLFYAVDWTIDWAESHSKLKGQTFLYFNFINKLLYHLPERKSLVVREKNDDIGLRACARSFGYWWLVVHWRWF